MYHGDYQNIMLSAVWLIKTGGTLRERQAAGGRQRTRFSRVVICSQRRLTMYKASPWRAGDTDTRYLGIHFKGLGSYLSWQWHPVFFRLKKSHYWWRRLRSGFRPPASCCMPHFGENQDFIHPSTRRTVINGIFIHGPSGAVLLNDLSLRSSQSKAGEQVFIPNYAMMKNQTSSWTGLKKKNSL